MTLTQRETSSADKVRTVSSKGSDQRDRVLAAAVDAIAEHGPDRVTVRDIAARAAISPSHVLYYFGRRDRILIETLRWSEEELAVRRHAQLRRARSPWKAMVRFVTLYLPTSADDTRWNLWNQVIARPPTDPETIALVGALEQVWVDDLAALIVSGIADGSFKPVDAPAVALQTRLLMDGVASDIVLGLPDRSVRWGTQTVTSALAEQLGVHQR
ncbi:MAG: TetR/AcrR family transcriptional regulator [Candidatus Nanopelagicales bacterium]